MKWTAFIDDERIPVETMLYESGERVIPNSERYKDYFRENLTLAA